jgi:serine/threonine protein kinase
MADSVKLLQGRYQIVEPIARGGMGAVYLAEDTRLPGRLGRHQGESGSTPGSRQQFEREAVILARLRHPNLPQVTDFFVEASGQQYLVMEYIPGQSAQQICSNAARCRWRRRWRSSTQ